MRLGTLSRRPSPKTSARSASLAPLSKKEQTTTAVPLLPTPRNTRQTLRRQSPHSIVLSVPRRDSWAYLIIAVLCPISGCHGWRSGPNHGRGWFIAELSMVDHDIGENLGGESWGRILGENLGGESCQALFFGFLCSALLSSKTKKQSLTRFSPQAECGSDAGDMVCPVSRLGWLVYAFTLMSKTSSR